MQDNQDVYEYLRNTQDSDRNDYIIYPPDALPICEVFNYEGQYREDVVRKSISHILDAYYEEYKKYNIDIALQVTAHKGKDGKLVYIIKEKKDAV